MAYSRTTWVDGTTAVNATNLNNIEAGIVALDNGKVSVVSGKGLSTNDYTTAEKNNNASNTSARHSHSNKSTLDTIDSTKVASWDGKSVVTGTGDGTNWTSLTVNGNTLAIPQGQGAQYTAGEGIAINNNQISVTSCNGYRFQYEREEPLSPQENVIYFIPISD